MDDWFESISTQTQLSSEAVQALRTDGFIVMPGPIPPATLAEVAHSYDEAVSGAIPEDMKPGSTTTRVRDFVNRGAEFDGLYLYPPILPACCRVIGQPFKTQHYARKNAKAANSRPAAPLWTLPAMQKDGRWSVSFS
jgi:hypothetical protein